MEKTNKLGVDIGGVIIDGSSEHKDTIFTDSYLETPEVSNSVSSLKTLLDNSFQNDIYLISKCGPRIQKRTLDWLDHHNFYDRTGVGKNNVYFSLERKNKVDICKRLNITHYIDDRLEILGYLSDLNICEKLFLFKPREKEVNKYKSYLKKVKRVESWNEVLEELL